MSGHVLGADRYAIRPEAIIAIIARREQLRMPFATRRAGRYRSRLATTTAFPSSRGMLYDGRCSPGAIFICYACPLFIV